MESILKDGLIPCINKVASFDFEDGDESRMGVYLTSNVEAVLSADYSFNEPIYAVLSVNVRDIKNDLIPDDAYDGLESIFDENDLNEGLYDQFSWFYKGIIPPKCIKFLKIVENN